MAYKSLEKLYRFFQPRAVEKNKNLFKGTITNTMMEKILNVNGEVFEYKVVKNDIETFIKSAKSTTSQQEPVAQVAEQKLTPVDVATKRFQAIGPSGPLDLGDKDFWGNKVVSVSGIVPGADKTSIIVVKDPRLSPMTANADVIGRFLNATPAVVTSQMIPYLDVQIIYSDTSFTSNPGPLRFLLGSVEVTQPGFNENDKTIFYRRKDIRDEKNVKAISGLETFLMPQSLNDMDKLSSIQINKSPGDQVRTIRAKPFIPFASIEGFDMSTKGAGFGTIPIGRATLKLKIHDRTRVSEIADLMRGAEGFLKMTVKTRYGWSAPNVGDDNEYTKFINEKMYIIQYWDIVQTQYSFDQSGQISFTITLATKNVEDMETTTTKKYSKKVEDLNVKMARIDNYRKKIGNNVVENPNLNKIIQEAASQGYYTDKKAPLQTYISALETQLKGAAKKGNFPLSDGEITQFITDLKSLLNDSADKKKETYENIINEDVKNGWSAIFDKLQDPKMEDPFLPTDTPASKKKFFEYGPYANDLISLVQKFKKDKQPDNDVKTPVASFAKVFTHFFGQQLQSPKNDVDEVQIIFYTLNGYCGPLSGRSIAEFPIDMSLLRRGYADIVKKTRSKDITLKEFMNIVNSTNFQDPRSIGYGRSQLYPAIEKNKPLEKAEIKPKTDAAQAEWTGKYGKFTIPLIEIYSDDTRETIVKEGSKPKKIRRIHIFDKTCTFEENTSASTKEQKIESVKSEVSVITLGSNGSTVIAASGGSRTNSGQDSVFAQRAYNNKGAGLGGTAIGEDGLGDEGSIPLRVTPLHLSLTTLGCPIVQNYQSFYIDFGTGTQLDNRYKVVEIQHNITQGKFVTSWKLLYDDAFAGLVTPRAPPASPNDTNKEIVQLINQKSSGPAAERPANPPKKPAKAPAKP